MTQTAPLRPTELRLPGPDIDLSASRNRPPSFEAVGSTSGPRYLRFELAPGYGSPRDSR